jgi:hypothetical protein
MLPYEPTWHKRRWFIYLTIVVAAFGIYFLNVYNFLSISEPAKPDLLVVEGWLHRDGLNQAKEEFLHNKYRFILTTGFPNSDGFLMGSNGRLVFETHNQIAASKDNIYKISITVRGTKANKRFPHFSLFADSTVIGSDYTTRNKKIFSYDVKSAHPPDSVMLEFDNDLFTALRDRNMYIYSISVNGKIFKTDNKRVICYFRQNGRYYLYQQLSPSSAQDAAEYLISLGIPDSLVVPVVTTRKFKSRTYASALDVKHWLDSHLSGSKFTLTVFSQGPHARRSFILYKKAFKSSADIGIISGKMQEYNSSNWWRNIMGWESVLYETVGLLYVSFFL